MKNNNALRYLVVVILTTAVCWVMFNASRHALRTIKIIYYEKH